MEEVVLKPLARRLDVRSQTAFNRAVELLRLVEVKCDQGVLGLSSNCRAVVCLEIAAGENSERLSRKDTAKAAGQKKQAYESAYQTIEKILGLSSRLGIHELAVQCGCSEVRELAQSLLKKYEDNVKAKLSADRQKDLDLSKPIYAIGALQAAAKKQKVQIDKKRLQSLVNGQRSALNQITSAMEDCLRQIGTVDTSCSQLALCVLYFVTEAEGQKKQSDQLLGCLEEVESGGIDLTT
jgi:hypothetical protein